jgi:hypothetical protein
MEHVFIQRAGHRRLILIFGGWGMDEHLLAGFAPADADVMLCYDYRQLNFSPEWVAGYEAITLWAWSMGVWAASQTFTQPACRQLPLAESIAINGTPMPIDDACGIPVAIFEATLAAMDPVSLRKFNRRMCGTSAMFGRFVKKIPHRPVDELKEEMAVIGRQVRSLPLARFAWTKALIGDRDLIFSRQNQEQAWTTLGIPYEVRDAAHYDDHFFDTPVLSRTKQKD